MILPNAKHEAFAQAIANGSNATKAYIAAGYSRAGATQSANRLLKDTAVRARIAEIRAEIGAKLTMASIRDKNARVLALQRRWEKMLRVIDERAAKAGPAAGSATGLLDDRGDFDKDLVRELREHELQAAKELAQFAERHEHSGPDGSPISIDDPRLKDLGEDELGQLAAILRKLAVADGSRSGDSPA